MLLFEKCYGEGVKRACLSFIRYRGEEPFAAVTTDLNWDVG